MSREDSAEIRKAYVRYVLAYLDRHEELLKSKDFHSVTRLLSRERNIKEFDKNSFKSIYQALIGKTTPTDFTLDAIEKAFQIDISFGKFEHELTDLKNPEYIKYLDGRPQNTDDLSDDFEHSKLNPTVQEEPEDKLGEVQKEAGNQDQNPTHDPLIPKDQIPEESEPKNQPAEKETFNNSKDVEAENKAQSKKKKRVAIFLFILVLLLLSAFFVKFGGLFSLKKINSAGADTVKQKLDSTIVNAPASKLKNDSEAKKKLIAQMDSIGTSGWIYLGNYDFSIRNYSDGDGPKFKTVSSVYPVVDHGVNVHIGDIISIITKERHVKIKGFQTTGVKRVLEKPYTIGPDDSTDVTLPINTEVKIEDFMIDGYNHRPKAVWVRVRLK